MVRPTAGSIGNDRSAAKRFAPAGLNINSIFYDARNDRIAIGKFKHFLLVLFIVLSIIIDEFDPVLVVVFAGLLTIWAPRLCINNQRHFRNSLPIYKITKYEVSSKFRSERSLPT